MMKGMDMDTMDPHRKKKKPPAASPPVIGVIMLLIGIMVMLLAPDTFSARESSRDRDTSVQMTTSETAVVRIRHNAKRDPEYKQEREQFAGGDAGETFEAGEGSLAESVAVQTASPAADPPHKPEMVSLGEYKITFYCKCAKCCGKSDGITATGTTATSNRTIAVDPKLIPFGSKVLIDGREYIAEDTGGFKGQTIDMFVDSHQEALSRGVIRKEVFMVQENK